MTELHIDGQFQYLRINDEQVDGFEEPFNLSIPVDGLWSKGERKVLVVVESVPSEDLRGGKLLEGENFRYLLFDILDQSIDHASSYGFNTKCTFAFANYNYFRWLHERKRKDLMTKVNNLAAERMERIVKRLKPDVILVLGDIAAQSMLSHANSISTEVQARNMRGCVHKYRIGKKTMPLVSTLDVDAVKGRYTRGSGAVSNVLGYVCRNLTSGIMGEHPHDLSHIEASPRYVNTMAKFDSMMKVLDSAKAIAFDLETTTLESHSNDILTAQFAVNTKHGYVLPIRHRDSPWTTKEMSKIYDRLREFFSQPMKWYSGKNTRYLIGQNLIFDIRIMCSYLNVRYCYWPIWDVSGGEHLLDENIRLLESFGTPSVNLRQMFAHYSNTHYFKAEFSKEDRSTIKDRDLSNDVLGYCAMDVQSIYGIHKEQMNRARALGYKKFRKLLLVQISSMVRTMSFMKSRGTYVDKNQLMLLMDEEGPMVKAINELKKELNDLPEVVEAREIVHEDMMANRKISGGQKSLFGGNGSSKLPEFKQSEEKYKNALFSQVMELEPLKVGKSGKPSFDRAFLDKYSDLDPIRLIIKLREFAKLKDTYVEGIYRNLFNTSVDSLRDGRLRADFDYVGIVSGRSNSSNPSLQQIPEHTEEAKFIKRLLVTPPGSLHVEADYAIHEVRCWGFMAGDRNLMDLMERAHEVVMEHRKRQLADPETIKLKADVHRMNYSMFTGTPIESVNDEMRQSAKGITYGAMYGMGDKSLAKSIDKSVREAKRIKDQFFAHNRQGGLWLDEQVRDAKKLYYTESPIGRRRNLYGHLAGEEYVSIGLDRLAKNSPIQGFASDIAFMSADIFSRAMHECLDDLGVVRNGGIETSSEYMIDDGKCWDLEYLPSGPNVTVHDSIKGESTFEYFYMYLHLLEWSMTLGVVGFIRSVYGVDIGCPIDIDILVGSNWSDKTKWNWVRRDLDKLIVKSVDSHKKIYRRVKEDKDSRYSILDTPTRDILRSMKRSYLKQQKKLELLDRFPIGSPIVNSTSKAS